MRVVPKMPTPLHTNAGERAELMKKLQDVGG